MGSILDDGATSHGGGYPSSHGGSTVRGTPSSIRERTSNVSASGLGSLGRSNTGASDSVRPQSSLGGNCALCMKPYSGYGSTCSS
mmetsp:Transcript_68576/g.149858  ORF Transcript_68576/g.149858 Transcript_68576/m.149858 type:complete len:85 (-) Transcript_68576:15-269(-)